ncbi:hypothetical protein LCGC14_2207110 [marine sediment metagenome]|uniref:Uncharacterized protein n=1 Tax=marine sediment metagenome TaxID=412755 RepID=A0A0F9FSD0_9ZZZZ
MATRRGRKRKPTKLEALRLARRQGDRDRALSIGLYVMRNPEALRGAGMLFEALGRAMQRTADDKQMTAPTTPTPPSDVFDLSALRERKKKPSDD